MRGVMPLQGGMGWMSTVSQGVALGYRVIAPLARQGQLPYTKGVQPHAPTQYPNPRTGVAQPHAPAQHHAPHTKGVQPVSPGQRPGCWPAPQPVAPTGHNQTSTIAAITAGLQGA